MVNMSFRCQVISVLLIGLTSIECTTDSRRDADEIRISRADNFSGYRYLPPSRAENTIPDFSSNRPQQIPSTKNVLNSNFPTAQSQPSRGSNDVNEDYSNFNPAKTRIQDSIRTNQFSGYPQVTPSLQTQQQQQSNARVPIQEIPSASTEAGGNSPPNFQLNKVQPEEGYSTNAQAQAVAQARARANAASNYSPSRAQSLPSTSAEATAYPDLSLARAYLHTSALRRPTSTSFSPTNTVQSAEKIPTSVKSTPESTEDQKYFKSSGSPKGTSVPSESPATNSVITKTSPSSGPRVRTYFQQGNIAIASGPGKDLQQENPARASANSLSHIPVGKTNSYESSTNAPLTNVQPETSNIAENDIPTAPRVRTFFKLGDTAVGITTTLSGPSVTSSKPHQSDSSGLPVNAAPSNPDLGIASQNKVPTVTNAPIPSTALRSNIKPKTGVTVNALPKTPVSRTYFQLGNSLGSTASVLPESPAVNPQPQPDSTAGVPGNAYPVVTTYIQYGNPAGTTSNSVPITSPQPQDVAATGAAGNALPVVQTYIQYGNPARESSDSVPANNLQPQNLAPMGDVGSSLPVVRTYIQYGSPSGESSNSIPATNLQSQALPTSNIAGALANEISYTPVSNTYLQISGAAGGSNTVSQIPITTEPIQPVASGVSSVNTVPSTFIGKPYLPYGSTPTNIFAGQASTPATVYPTSPLQFSQPSSLQSYIKNPYSTIGSHSLAAEALDLPSKTLLASSEYGFLPQRHSIHGGYGGSLSPVYKYFHSDMENYSELPTGFL